MHHTPLIAMLVGGICLAFVFGMLAQRLRLSPLFGYLVAGVVVGPFTPGFVADSAIAKQLSEIGVILLMFGVGLHFSIGDLWSVRKIAIPGALFQIVIATSLGMLLGWAMGWSWGSSLIFGVCLSVASTVVLLRALEERRLLETQRGRIAIGWLIVEDLITVLVLVMLPPVAGLLGGDAEGAGSGSTADILKALAWTLGKVTVFIALMLAVGRRVIPWALERTASVGSRELFTLAVLAIALGVAYVSAAIFEVSFALGAFLAGVMLNESKLSHEAANDSLPMRDAFAVLFFVSVGMLFDPHILLEQPLAILATFPDHRARQLVLRFHRRAHVRPALADPIDPGHRARPDRRILVHPGRTRRQPRPAQRGCAKPDPGRRPVSIIVNPMLFVLFDRWSATHEADIHAAAERTLDAMEDDTLPDRAAIPRDNHIILVGYGRVGSRVARALHEHGMPLVLIDSDRDHCVDARKLGIPCIFGNAVSTEVLSDANLGSARALLVAISQALVAGPIIRLAREANPGDRDSCPCALR